jgi:hypothetical protein
LQSLPIHFLRLDEGGDVRFSADWDGYIESYPYNADIIDNLKHELEVLEVTFR